MIVDIIHVGLNRLWRPPCSDPSGEVFRHEIRSKGSTSGSLPNGSTSSLCFTPLSVRTLFQLIHFCALTHCTRATVQRTGRYNDPRRLFSVWSGNQAVESNPSREAACPPPCSCRGAPRARWPRRTGPALSRLCLNWGPPDCREGGLLEAPFSYTVSYTICAFSGVNARRPYNEAVAGPSLSESGRPDLNRRPPEPHSGALPGCATSRNRYLHASPAPREGEQT